MTNSQFELAVQRADQLQARTAQFQDLLEADTILLMRHEHGF